MLTQANDLTGAFNNAWRKHDFARLVTLPSVWHHIITSSPLPSINIRITAGPCVSHTASTFTKARLGIASQQPKTRKLRHTCYQQADIRMRFARLTTACWRQVCCKLSTDLLQVNCQNLLSPALLQIVSISCNRQVATSLILTAWNWQLCCKLLTSCN